MNQKERVIELLNTLKQFYNQSINYFDDSEKEIYLPKIQKHLDFINQTYDKVNDINPLTETGIMELVNIHSEILNKYFS